MPFLHEGRKIREVHRARLKRLIKNLNSPDASKRRYAAEALAEGDERAIYPLIKALRDENLGVQDAAMRSLIAIGGEVTAYMVLPLLREEALLRNTALIILKEIGRVAVPLLHLLLKDRDDDVRKFALDLIYDIRHCDYPEKIVEILKKDPNANVRAAAAKTLGVLDYRDAVQHLIEALHDEEWVCFSALEALAEIKDETSVKPIAALLDNQSDTIRYAAIEVLGKIGSPMAGEPLLKHISKANDLEKRASIKSLICIGAITPIEGMSDILLDMLRNGEWEDKLIALKGLVTLREERAIHYIVDTAGSLDPAVPDNEDRILAFKEALREFGCTESLMKVLDDPGIKWRGRVMAIEVIGDLRCREAVPSLIRLLQGRIRDVRRESIKALGKMGDTDDVKELLIDAVEDPDSHVRRAAVAALGRIGEMTAFEPIMKLLQVERYDDVIEEAVRALLNINSSLLLSQINELDEDVRGIVSRIIEPDTGLEVQGI